MSHGSVFDPPSPNTFYFHEATLILIFTPEYFIKGKKGNIFEALKWSWIPPHHHHLHHENMWHSSEWQITGLHSRMLGHMSPLCSSQEKIQSSCLGQWRWKMISVQLKYLKPFPWHLILRHHIPWHGSLRFIIDFNFILYFKWLLKGS